MEKLYYSVGTYVFTVAQTRIWFQRNSATLNVQAALGKENKLILHFCGFSVCGVFF